MGAPVLKTKSEFDPVTPEEAAALARIRTTPELGSRLRAARNVLGLAAHELGAMVDVHSSTVLNLESGRVPVSNFRAAAVIRALIDLHPNGEAVAEGLTWPVEEPAQAELLPIREDVDPFAPSSLALAAYKAVEALEEMVARAQHHARMGLIEVEPFTAEALRIADTLKEAS